jgi:hypothetical protein
MSEVEREFQAPKTITPEDLGDDLARLVWESFSDFIEDGDTGSVLGELGLIDEEGEPDQTAVEEALIFLMWAHTRGTQLAFVGRSPGELLKESLDTMHRAVFEDMVDNGTPRTQLPLFEQRVSARYSEYHRASASSDVVLGETVAKHLTGSPTPAEALKWAVTERARAVAGPLKDYLEDVDLVD